jgi:SAM-dependent methyltransferase
MADDYAEASRRSWGAAAGTFARAVEEPDRDASAAAGGWVLEAAVLEPGQRVLELACGAGRVGLQAAEAVGAGGHVLCSDFAEPMVEAVRARAAALGLANVEARVIDAEAIDLPGDDVFDRILCRFGFMLMARPGLALAESRRHLAEGGRIALAVWGTAEENPWLSAATDALVRHFDAPPPPPGTPGPFALGDEPALRALLDEAGFAEAAVTRLEVEQNYDSLEGWWERIVAVGGPLAAALAAIPEDEANAIREAAIAAAAIHEQAGGTMSFPATVLGATAIRPA